MGAPARNMLSLSRRAGAKVWRPQNACHGVPECLLLGGGVAQSVEQHPCKPWAAGSSPAFLTNPNQTASLIIASSAKRQKCARSFDKSP